MTLCRALVDEVLGYVGTSLCNIRSLNELNGETDLQMPLDVAC